MDTQIKDTPPTSEPQQLTALDLNNIRLDVRHTVLTPDYLMQDINKSE